MAISQYWVGQIPSRPISIGVRDSTGVPTNLGAYTEFNVILLGSDNEEIDLTGAVLSTQSVSTGRLTFFWPKDRSVFNKPGQYVMQLEIVGPTGTRDYTTEHTIRVRKLGGVK